MRLMLGILGGVFVVAYPFAVYFGLARWGLQTAGRLLIALAVAGAVLRLLSSKKTAWGPILRGPAMVVALVLSSLWLNDPRLMLALPTAINAVLLVSFGRSLRGPTSMIERFALMVEPKLNSAQMAHCRSFTVAWMAFFAANGSLAGALAIWAPFQWWVVYTGAISYGLMGVMFAVEYLLRKYRFQQFSDLPHDRLLAVFLSRQVSASRADGESASESK